GPGGQRDGVGEQGNLAGGDGDHEPVQVDPGGAGPGAEHGPANLTGEPFQDRRGDQVSGEGDHGPSSSGRGGQGPGGGHERLHGRLDQAGPGPAGPRGLVGDAGVDGG